jgi:hypothetical protein
MSEGMDDDRFAHMLKLSTVYISVLKSRCLFDDLREMDSSEEHNALNCLEIVADTFIEMQRRLSVKPKFRINARAALTSQEPRT